MYHLWQTVWPNSGGISTRVILRALNFSRRFEIFFSIWEKKVNFIMGQKSLFLAGKKKTSCLVNIVLCEISILFKFVLNQTFLQEKSKSIRMPKNQLFLSIVKETCHFKGDYMYLLMYPLKFNLETACVTGEQALHNHTHTQHIGL